MKVVPDTCCRDFSEFSKYVDGVIIDAGVEVNPHGRYGHALQTLTIAKHVDKVFGEEHIKVLSENCRSTKMFGETCLILI